MKFNITDLYFNEIKCASDTNLVFILQTQKSSSNNNTIGLCMFVWGGNCIWIDTNSGNNNKIKEFIICVDRTISIANIDACIPYL